MLATMFAGMLRTIGIFVLTLLGSLPLGMIIMFGRKSKSRVLSAVVKGFISIIRGTPLMLQLLVWYFGPFYLFGWSIKGYRFPAIIIGFVVNYACYFAEIYRGGIESMDRGQYEAAEILGYSKSQTFFRIILPQVVKTARTMKRAVEILGPVLSQGKGVNSVGRVLLATVKGDVHDIGKNIVGVVMACNGYEIIDMGVMVPAEEIVRKALETKPDIIGLSGLITPSLEEMVRVVAQLREAGIQVPVMIGGATTSPLHTALKIAPVYEGPVIWVKDASQNAPLASRFLSSETKVEAEASLKHEQEELRKGTTKPRNEILPFEEARRRKAKLF